MSERKRMESIFAAGKVLNDRGELVKSCGSPIECEKDSKEIETYGIVVCHL